MSDCFDHALDAYDSLAFGDRKVPCCYGPVSNMYYTDVRFKSIVRETDKAILVVLSAKEALLHIRVKLCRRFNIPPDIQVWIPLSVIKEGSGSYLTVHSRVLRNNIRNTLRRVCPEIKLFL